jgi:signal peptidase II
MSMKRWTLFSIVTGIGLISDQFSKLYVDRAMDLHQSIPVINGLFSFTYLRNRGAAFSFLSNVSWRLPFFIAVSLIAAAVILVAFKKMRDDQTMAQIALAMIFSGAIGNLIDRIRLGEVVDFLDVYWKSHHWPAFNVADSLICVGVGLVVVDMLKEERRQQSSMPK